MKKNQSNKKKPSISGSYTTAEVARMLNISRPTAAAFLKDSSLRLFKFNRAYRVMKVDFENWLEGTEEGENG